MDIEPRPDLFLGPDARVPLDRPFTRREAVGEGATDRQLHAWCDAGDLMNPVRGVYHSAQLPQGLELRVACLKLVAPPDAVITDRTAGWLHGAPMILAPNDHLTVPRVSMFRCPGYRMRNELTQSGERSFAAGEVIELDGLRVTSKLRTACDLGMMRGPDNAMAGLDQMMHVADGDFDLAMLCDMASGRRFRGYRRVRQFRELAPWADARSQSPPESAIKRRWKACVSLPPPELQVPVRGPYGMYYLDLGVEGLRYAVEYDGPRWHGPEQQAHDRERRSWLSDSGDWLIDVLVDHHVYGPAQVVERVLYEGIATAKRRFGARGWQGQAREPGVGS